jgi:hypothetical protein
MRERQFYEWLDLARRYSADPECTAAVQGLVREYRAQIAAYQRWRRRTDEVRERGVRAVGGDLARNGDEFVDATPRATGRRRHRERECNQLRSSFLLRADVGKLPQQRRRALPPDSRLLKPRRGERNAVDPQLMQWARDLGPYILAQDDPVTALQRLLGEKQPAGKRAKNAARDLEIATAVATKMDKGMPLEDAIAAVAKEHGLSEKRVRTIYFRWRVEARAARYQDI